MPHPAASHEVAVASAAQQLEDVRARLASQMSTIGADIQRWRSQVLECSETNQHDYHTINKEHKCLTWGGAVQNPAGIINEHHWRRHSGWRSQVMR